MATGRPSTTAVRRIIRTLSGGLREALASFPVSAGAALLFWPHLVLFVEREASHKASERQWVFTDQRMACSYLPAGSAISCLRGQLK